MTIFILIRFLPFLPSQVNKCAIPPASFDGEGSYMPERALIWRKETISRKRASFGGDRPYLAQVGLIWWTETLLGGKILFGRSGPYLVDRNLTWKDLIWWTGTLFGRKILFGTSGPYLVDRNLTCKHLCCSREPLTCADYRKLGNASCRKAHFCIG